MGQLQRILLGPYIVFKEGDHGQVEEIFNRVIFPLLDELLKPQVFQRDHQGMPETRLRASALLCKAFMYFEVRENDAKADIRILWIQILDLLDRLMNIDKGGQLVRDCKACVIYLTVTDPILQVRGCSRIPKKCYFGHERSWHTCTAISS